MGFIKGEKYQWLGGGDILRAGKAYKCTRVTYDGDVGYLNGISWW